MKDTIMQLYDGEIHPAERSYTKDSTAEKLLTKFSDSADWLMDNLEGEAKAKLLELINCHNELDSITAYENFRDGFKLGAQMMISIMMGGES